MPRQCESTELATVLYSFRPQMQRQLFPWQLSVRTVLCYKLIARICSFDVQFSFRCQRISPACIDNEHTRGLRAELYSADVTHRTDAAISRQTTLCRHGARMTCRSTKVSQIDSGQIHWRQGGGEISRRQVWQTVEWNVYWLTRYMVGITNGVGEMY